MSDDLHLLQQFVRERSDAAFRELVQRRIALVYSVALRQTGDHACAEDVTQTVFADLARKAPALCQRTVLIGWLYRSTQYAARQAVRTEARRRRRELEAVSMENDEKVARLEPVWDRLRPTLDEALDELNERDRDAVLLRFFDHQTFAAIGQRLNLTENAARMRVERALDKLHGLLASRGVTSTSAAIGLALASQASAALPAGLAGTVGTAALAGAAGTGLTTAVLTYMSSIKLQGTLAAGILAAGTTGLVVEHHQQKQLQADREALQPLVQSLATHEAEQQALRARQTQSATLQAVEAEYQRLQQQMQSVRERQALAAQLEATQPRKSSTRVEGPILDPRQLDTMPKPRWQARPVYPQLFRQTGTSGEATVSFVVDSAGTVHDVQTVKATHTEFGAAAKAAVEQWQFAPGQRAGLPVNTRLQVPIVFTVDRSPDAGPGTNNWF